MLKPMDKDKFFLSYPSCAFKNWKPLFTRQLCMNRLFSYNIFGLYGYYFDPFKNMLSNQRQAEPETILILLQALNRYRDLYRYLKLVPIETDIDNDPRKMFRDWYWYRDFTFIIMILPKPYKNAHCTSPWSDTETDIMGLKKSLDQDRYWYQIGCWYRHFRYDTYIPVYLCIKLLLVGVWTLVVSKLQKELLYALNFLPHFGGNECMLNANNLSKFLYYAPCIFFGY